MNEEKNEKTAKIFLGSYLNPTVGNWIELPRNEESLRSEIKKTKQEVKEKVNGEELGIMDTEHIPFDISESTDPYRINKAMNELKDRDISIEKAKDLIEKIDLQNNHDIEEIPELIDEKIRIYKDINTQGDLGKRVFDEIYGFDSIPEHLNGLIDFRKYGRQLSMSYKYNIDFEEQKAYFVPF